MAGQNLVRSWRPRLDCSRSLNEPKLKWSGITLFFGPCLGRSKNQSAKAAAKAIMGKIRVSVFMVMRLLRPSYPQGNA